MISCIDSSSWVGITPRLGRDYAPFIYKDVKKPILLHITAFFPYPVDKIKSPADIRPRNLVNLVNYSLRGILASRQQKSIL